mgnify:CR=1 FL=1
MTAVASKEYPTGLIRVVIVLTCIVASLLELIDTTIVNVSLHHIAGTLGASTTDVAWVITAYAISNVIIIPLSTMLSEIFGRRRYYTFSILIFTFASFMCGNSDFLVELVIWRFIQGLGGGALLSLSQSILLDAFPPEKLNLASAVYGMGVALGPALGPTLGGIITDNYSWHWIFFINVPLGLMAIISSWVVVSDQKERHIPDKIDWTGIFFLAIGVGCLQYVLEEGNANDWFDDRAILCLSIVAAIGIILFVVRELTTKNPAVNLSLLKHRNLSMGVALNFCMMAILFIGIYAFPLLVQIDLGWTATMTGVALVPGAIVTSIGMIVCQKLLAKGVKSRTLIQLGFLASFIFAASFTFQSPSSSWNSLFWPLIFRGLGVGLYMMPAISMAVKGFQGTDMGHAVGLSNMARQLGGAVGLALIGTQITNTQGATRSVLISHIHEYEPVTREVMNKISGMLQVNGFDVASAKSVACQYMEAQVLQQSSLLSYLTSFRIMAIVCLIGFLASFFIKE